MTATRNPDTSTTHVERVNAAAAEAREALERALGAAWEAGHGSRVEDYLVEAAYRDVTAAVTELVTLALHVEDQP